MWEEKDEKTECGKTVGRKTKNRVWEDNRKTNKEQSVRKTLRRQRTECGKIVVNTNKEQSVGRQ